MLGLMLPHCCHIFFTACGAAFGLEPLGGAVGPGWAVVLILVTPFSLEPTYRVDGCGTCDSHAGGGPNIMFGSAMPLDRCGQCNRRADVCLTLRVCRIGVIHYSTRLALVPWTALVRLWHCGHWELFCILSDAAARAVRVGCRSRRTFRGAGIVTKASLIRAVPTARLLRTNGYASMEVPVLGYPRRWIAGMS